MLRSLYLLSLTLLISTPFNQTGDLPLGSTPAAQDVDNFWGISCLDTPWRLDTPEQLLPIAKEQQNLSYFADVFADALSWRCATWRFEAAEYYTGPFVAKTATPILFVGGKRDPITPLAGAFNASAGFEESVVVTNDAYGHSFTADRSQCTYDTVNRYLVDGVLPEPGLVCKP
ncbi:hypothetical protein KVT40_005000 [Elsinoe batatas]|uniref:Peptidase S33 tripeptidyl aminopeptidase-like C-terminal domain-containing protein n=1 Tax=Elsinoe batatas TaxID=2601811 RepID=A0A8K0L1S3_9PEZI|nr:hypothetical protein KVT40_005000 [Elsinoe batatas]